MRALPHYCFSFKKKDFISMRVDHPLTRKRSAFSSKTHRFENALETESNWKRIQCIQSKTHWNENTYVIRTTWVVSRSRMFSKSNMANESMLFTVLLVNLVACLLPIDNFYFFKQTNAELFAVFQRADRKCPEFRSRVSFEHASHHVIKHFRSCQCGHFKRLLKR